MSLSIIGESESILTQTLPYILISFFGFIVITFMRIMQRISRIEAQLELLLKGKRLISNNK